MGGFRPEVLFWVGLAAALIAAETLVPGAFLLWLGLAAAGVWLLVLVVPGLEPLWQAVAFVALSFVSIGVYLGFFRRRRDDSDQPLLNRRSEQMVGTVLVLGEALANGQGRARIGDAFWAITGPDLPVGTRVRVVASEGMQLRVAPVD